MRAFSLSWQAGLGWSENHVAKTADLILYFGLRDLIADGKAAAGLAELFPDARIVGCSTGGQSNGGDVEDDIVCATALSFEHTRIEVVAEPVTGPENSRACGKALGAALKDDGLAAIFVLSDGLQVNGSSLVAGLMDEVGDRVPVTGGLAGDGPDFARTLVGCNGTPKEGQVAAIGFYGEAIRIGHGIAGGWDVFGPRRLITRSSGNVLYELDGQPALDLYERYLGEEDAKRLPGSALLFPMTVFDPKNPEHDIVRTVLSVDRDARTMTFAGDVPEGWSARLMRGHFANLITGAADATRQAVGANHGAGDSAAIFVSCIGRRLLLGQRVDEEIAAAMAELPEGTVPIGFYSYGEVSPHAVSGICEMHNQTMTVTTLREIAG